MGSGGVREKILANLRQFVEDHFVSEHGVPVKLAPYQEKFIRAVLERKHRKYIWLASTRVGKTEACAIAATLMAILYDGEEVTIVAPTFKQAERMFKRIRNYFMSNKRLYSLVDFSGSFRRDEITLFDKSVIRCLSAANPESLLGFGASVLIVDEAGSIPDEVFRTRILRMLASAKASGKEPVLILLGTPHVRNHFFDAWMSDDFWKMRTTWKEGVEAGILDEEEVMYAKKRLSENEFKMWYEARFVGSGKSLFDLDKVKELGVMRRMKEPEDGFDYYAGLDVARLGTDESAFVVVRIPKGVSLGESQIEVVYYSTRSKRPLTDIARWAEQLVERWNVNLLAVDATALGAGVFDYLRERLGGRVVGVKMIGAERRDAYLNLAHLIETDQILLPADEKFLAQFESFELSFSSDGVMRLIKNPRMLDDLVDALALACMVLKREKGMTVEVFEEMLRWLR